MFVLHIIFCIINEDLSYIGGFEFVSASVRFFSKMMFYDIHTHTHTHIYIYRERGRERERGRPVYLLGSLAFLRHQVLENIFNKSERK